MIYRNTRTGVEVVTHSEVKGEWERVDAPSVPVKKTEEVKTETTERKRAKKK